MKDCFSKSSKNIVDRVCVFVIEVIVVSLNRLSRSGRRQNSWKLCTISKYSNTRAFTKTLDRSYSSATEENDLILKLFKHTLIKTSLFLHLFYDYYLWFFSYNLVIIYWSINNCRLLVWFDASFRVSSLSV